MNAKIVSFCFLILLPALLFAQKVSEYSFANIDPELLENADEVVRLDYQEFEVHSRSVGKATRKIVVTILNKDSNADHLVFHYDNHRKVDDISIRIFDASGNLVRKVKRGDLTDHSAIPDYSIYDDSRYKYYRATHFSYPYTIEYEYEEELTGIQFAAFPDKFIQDTYNTSIESSVFILKLPPEMDFHYRIFNKEDNVRKSKEKDLTVYSWEFNHLPALLWEVNMPRSAEVFSFILTSPDRFKIDKYEGGLSSWDEFSTFVYKLYEGRDQLPEDLEAEILKMTKDATSDLDKINILYSYLQTNYRYVSVQLDLGGWQPFDAEYVYRNKFGDCKALTNFMAAMLKVVGIESSPALIGSGDIFYHVTEDFTSARFNHVILCIPGYDYWLECTSNVYPPNYVGSGNANRFALLIQETDGQLVKTPSLTSVENIRKGKTEIRFKEDGSADIKTNVTTSGSRHEIFRAIENQLTETETRKWLENQTSIPSVSFKSFNVTSENHLPESSFIYEAESRRYGSLAGKRIFLPLNVINSHKNIPPKQEERKYPILIERGFVELDTIVLHLPKDYTVESIPEEKIFLDKEFGTYSMQVEQHKDQLVVMRRLEIKRTKLAPEMYDEFRNFLKLVAKADSHKGVLVKKRV